MIKNYFTLAWRKLRKNKIFSIINILGLSIGITVCMMIFLFIMNEFSFDKFHKKGDHIYRVMRTFPKEKMRIPYLSGPYASALLTDFPNDIKYAVRVMNSGALVSINERSFNENSVVLTEPEFFDLFSYPLVKGNPATALKDPNSVVLNETTAKKYFGNEDPMGKTITVDKKLQLKVTGIIKDAPSNSHLNFDLIYPISNYYKEPWFAGWFDNSMFVYVLLNEKTNVANLENQFPRFMEKHMGKQMRELGFEVALAVTPLSEIYFEPAMSFDAVRHGDKKVVFIFLSIAILILLIACINFMNLSTIAAVERSKEVGLRKVMGALKNHLVWQFIGESILIAFISSILAVVFLLLLMPFYNQLLENSLSVSWSSPPIYLFLAGVILMIGLLAGSYPAFFMSAFSPIESLKGKLKLGKGGTLFRQVLVVVQFSISVFLIIGTIIMSNQMNYVKNKSLGYDQEQAIVIRIDNNEINNNRRTFKNELEKMNGVASVSGMSGEPGGFFDTYPFEVEGQTDKWKSRTEFADFEYVKTLGLKIIAGRDFSPQFSTDTTDAALINRTAATKLGFTPEQAIGKWIKNTAWDSARRRIVGVIEDFNFLSLKENMDALVISPVEQRRVFVVKMKPGNIASTIESIKKTYSKLAPVYPFSYTFLDQKFETMYRTDIRQQKILSIFSGLAIFIACLGLFGLTSFTAAKRTKEIGVRKVLGSSTQNIVMLLSKDLLKPVFIATVLAVPVGYLAMNNWLQNFAYKTPLSWWIFVLAALITFGIALITVSFKAVRAAMANPVKSLRTE